MTSFFSPVAPRPAPLLAPLPRLDRTSRSDQPMGNDQPDIARPKRASETSPPGPALIIAPLSPGDRLPSTDQPLTVGQPTVVDGNELPSPALIIAPFSPVDDAPGKYRPIAKIGDTELGNPSSAAEPDQAEGKNLPTDPARTTRFDAVQATFNKERVTIAAATMLGLQELFGAARQIGDSGARTLQMPFPALEKPIARVDPPASELVVEVAHGDPSLQDAMEQVNDDVPAAGGASGRPSLLADVRPA